MEKQAYYCREDQSVDEAQKIMREHGLQYLPVVDSNLRIVGVVRMKDVITWTNVKQMALFNRQSAAILPLAKVAFEAHALGDLKRRDDAALDLLAAFPARSQARPVFLTRLIKVGGKSVPFAGFQQRQQFFESLFASPLLADNRRAVHYRVIKTHGFESRMRCSGYGFAAL